MVDAGHYGTEQVVIPVLADYIRESKGSRGGAYSSGFTDSD